MTEVDWEITKGNRNEEWKKQLRKLLGVMDMFFILTVVMFSQLYVKTYQTVQFKYIKSMVCQLYFNEAA